MSDHEQRVRETVAAVERRERANVEAKLTAALATARAKLARAEGLYHELLYGVANKHPNETRHQTALRYIMQAEQNSNQGGADAASEQEPRT